LLEEGDRLGTPDDDAAAGPAPVLVHAALSSFGSFVPGGEKTVLNALTAACALQGRTLAMPAHADPGCAHTAAADRKTFLLPRKSAPGRGPCREMGRIADRFRRTTGVVRSDHPLLSFCAKGPLADALLGGHEPETGLGFDSPLGKLLEKNALILMLGTSWETCTALHLAEYAHAGDERVTCWARSGGKDLVWEDIPYRTELFAELGTAFEQERPAMILSGPIPRFSEPPSRRTARSSQERGHAPNPTAQWKLVRMPELISFCIDRYPHFR